MKIIVTLFALCSVAVHAQQELCGGLLPARLPYNCIKIVGKHTWFTYLGTLYRKHVDSGIAEVWYRKYDRVSGTSLYSGLLVDANTTAYRKKLTSENSSLPANIRHMRFDSNGVLWFAGGDVLASFNGVGWHVSKRSAGDLVRDCWGKASPFGDQPLNAEWRRVFVPDDSLLNSIPDRRGDSVMSAGKLLYAVYTFEVDTKGTLYLDVGRAIEIFRPLTEHESIDTRFVAAAAPFPNPAPSAITFSLDDVAEGEMSVDIRDLTGRLRIQDVKGVCTSTQVDVTGLEEGVYVAVLRSKNGAATTSFTVRR